MRLYIAGDTKQLKAKRLELEAKGLKHRKDFLVVRIGSDKIGPYEFSKVRVLPHKRTQLLEWFDEVRQRMIVQ